MTVTLDEGVFFMLFMVGCRDCAAVMRGLAAPLAAKGYEMGSAAEWLSSNHP
jgi:hypothetical protein